MGSRGKAIIPGTDTRSNVAYGLMATPDRVQNIVMPQDGLIFVAYQATWQESVANAARAAICLGSTPIQQAYGESSPHEQNARINNYANKDIPLTTTAGGLVGTATGGVTPYSGDVTTGQMVGSSIGSAVAASEMFGGPVAIFAAAGTYDVSVQFKASSGSVTVKNRKLWVWAQDFG